MGAKDKSNNNNELHPTLNECEFSTTKVKLTKHRHIDSDQLKANGNGSFLGNESEAENEREDTPRHHTFSRTARSDALIVADIVYSSFRHRLRKKPSLKRLF